MKWKTTSPANTDERSYKYSYDNLYRLTGATYQAKTGSSWTKDQNGFNETLSYDENGNIKTLLRKSVISGSVTTIDDLTYYYKNSDNNNQLDYVTDGVSTNATGYGFRNFAGAGSTAPYGYDDNGNLIGDPKKGTTITYNELNKPTLIQISSTKKVEYRYDAAGTRISKYVYNNSSTITKSIEYIGGYVIENDILSYYSMAEGRVRNEGGGFGLSMKMEYFITDQQGNTRVSFEDNGSGTAVVKQENSYYAFGMQMAGGYIPTTNPNKKLYNAGSEWQDDIEGLADYYSTFFREYDPIIGRFNGVDILAEMTDEISTYAYADNNPVMMNDPLGDAAAYTTEDMIREMREEYRAWHDPLYGDNSSWSTLERQMSLWGWGDWSSSGGGGGSYAGSYQQLKDRINEYGHEGWREINADALREYFENLWSGTGRISIGVKESGGVNKGKGFNVGWYQDIPTSEGSRAAHGKFISIDEAVSLLSGEVGRGRDGLDNLQTGLGAFDVAWGAKEELINFAGKSSSAINNMKYVKGVKVVSKGLFWTQAGLSTYNAVSAWRNSDRDWTTNQGNKWGVTTKAALDIAIGAISLWGGPIGWIIGGAYFIADAAGAFDSWSKPEN